MAPVLTSDLMVASPPPADQPAATGGAMSIDQFCQYACIGKTKVYAEVKSRRLQLRKIGSKTVVFRSEAERWLRALPTDTEDLQRSTKAKPRSPRRSTSGTPPANDESQQGADLHAEVE